MSKINLCKAKRTDNGEWVIGYYVESNELHYIVGTVEERCAGELETELLAKEWYLIDVTTLCRNTGIPDKNNNIIWENDIVKNIGYKERCIVNQFKGDWIGRYYPQTPFYDYSEADIVFKKSQLCYVNLGFYVYERNAIEVIGNVFDNPELLEKA